MITTMFKKWKVERKAKKLKRAAELVRAAGFAICEFKVVAGTTYIRANDGSWNRVGRAANDRI